MNPSRVAVLQNTAIFGGVRADILQFILDASPQIAVAKGGFFFREHERADSMFVLEQGEAAVLKAWQGHEYLLHHLHAGDCFGEMSLIDLQPRSASLLALEDSCAVEIGSATLAEVHAHDLAQLALIYMNMGREVSRRLRAMDECLFAERIKLIPASGHYTFSPK
ncbi:MAG: cyclic nucleotide-binding domain-containing protein [Betaproteobacteria bacterium]|nr:cyclic nucleotide-binding domain-containing protein [Betaproteobacteria bacterium]